VERIMTNLINPRRDLRNEGNMRSKPAKTRMIMFRLKRQPAVSRFAIISNSP
jgi:hypothetical protein